MILQTFVALLKNCRICPADKVLNLLQYITWTLVEKKNY